MNRFQKFCAILGFVLLLVAAPAVLAEGGTGAGTGAGTGTKDKTPSSTTNSDAKKAEAEKRAAEKAAKEAQAKEAQEARKAKLESKKLEACQKAQAKINATIARLADRSQKQYDLYTTTFNRVKTFYVDKQLSIANYDSLVAEVNAKQAAASAALANIKSTTVTIDCSGDDPKGSTQTFKSRVDSAGTPFKDYHSAVKKLIAAIKASAPDRAKTSGGSQ